MFNNFESLGVSGRFVGEIFSRPRPCCLIVNFVQIQKKIVLPAGAGVSEDTAGVSVDVVDDDVVVVVVVVDEVVDEVVVDVVDEDEEDDDCPTIGTLGGGTGAFTPTKYSLIQIELFNSVST